MTDSCWRCGADYEPPKPRRSEFDNEPDFLVACLEWLDYTFPERGRAGQSARVAEWRRLEASTDREAVRARIRALIARDDWSTDDAAEFDQLAATWKSLRGPITSTQEGA